MTPARFSAVALSLAASPAAALTPEELWSTWQAQVRDLAVMMEAFEGPGALGGPAANVALEADRVPGPGGALTLRNIRVTAPDGSVQPLPPGSPVQEVTLTPVEGGAVRIDLVGLPERFDIPTGDPTAGDVRVETRGLALLARDAGGGAAGGAADGAAGGATGGAAGQIAYEAMADSLTVAALPPVDGPDGGSAMGDFALEVAGLALGTSGGMEAGDRFEVSLRMDGFAYLFDTGVETGFGARQSGRTEGTQAFTMTFALPASAGLVEIGQALEGLADAAAGQAFLGYVQDGLGLAVRYENGASTQEAWVEGFPFSYSYASSFEAGGMDLSFDRTGFLASGASGGGSGQVSSPSLPIPSVDVSFGPLDFEFRFPIGPEPGDWRYSFALRDLVVNEDAWAALDPEGLLPQGPARMVVDVGGRMTLDLAELGGPQKPGVAPPAPEIESLEVREFDVAVAGVEATGEGSFTFDNTTGVPVPVGEASARVAGLDRMLDALVSLGWITAEDARNARLGLAVAFRAGDGPDVRVTQVEARPGGAVFVNGVQVQ
jgi:hypothetical protein